MSIIQVNGIKKYYDDKLILDNISFIVNEKDKIAIIGQNGCGKSTLMNILSGVCDYDDGKLYTAKDIKLAYLRQQTGIKSDSTVFEEMLCACSDINEYENKLRDMENKMSSNASSIELSKKLMEDYSNMLDSYEKMGGYTYESEIKSILQAFSFDESYYNLPVNSLSGGQKSKLMLAKSLLTKPDILFLDEPTNHLDIQSIEFLQKFIEDYKKTVILISHDRYFLSKTVNRIFLIKDKKIHIYDMPYDKYTIQRKKDLEILENSYINQMKEIKRQQEIIKRFRAYGSEKYLKKAKSREKLLNKIELIENEKEDKNIHFSFKKPEESSYEVLRLNEVCKSFPDLKLLNSISLNIYKGEKVGLIGENGCGKSTLFKIILNKAEKDSGEIIFGSNVKTAYFDQELAGIDNDKTVIDEIWDSFPKLSYFEIRSVLARFMFINDDIFKDIEELSGGEKSRLALLKIMLGESNFLMLDEPTNHLDMDSKEILEDELCEYKGTVFVISHDRYFLNKVCNKILELKSDKIHEYLGNYDYFVEKKKSLEMEEKFLRENEDIKTKTQIKYDKKKQRDEEKKLREFKKEKKRMENEIAKLELEKADLTELLSDPSIYDNIDKVHGLNEDLRNINDEIEKLYEAFIEYEDSFSDL